MSEEDYIYYTRPNRTYCDALRELRTLVEILDKIGNFQLQKKRVTVGHMLLLIEEVQTYGNRMEGRLEDFNDFKSLHESRKELAKKCIILEKEVVELERKAKKLKEESK